MGSVWEDVFEEDVEKGLEIGCAGEIKRWNRRSLCARREANASGLVQEQHRGIIVPGKVVGHGCICARLQPASAHFVEESKHRGGPGSSIHPDDDGVINRVVSAVEEPEEKAVRIRHVDCARPLRFTIRSTRRIVLRRQSILASSKRGNIRRRGYCCGLGAGQWTLVTKVEALKLESVRDSG